MSQQNELYDVTIIGGGAAGLFTAFYSGMREMKTKVIEYLPFLGGKVASIYPEKVIRDIGGISHVTGAEPTEQLIQQAKTFDPTIVLGEQITNVEKDENGRFILTSNHGAKHYTKTIILATGFGALKPIKLNLPEARSFEGKNLHYTIKRLESYRGKQVMISGGENSAVEWANELEPIADKVSIVYRKSNFPGIESSVTEMTESSVEIYTSQQITRLKGTDGQFSSVILQHAASKQLTEIPIDELIINHGFEIDLGPIANWGMKMEQGSIQVDRSMATSIPGIFAIGDIASYPHKLLLITGAFYEGPIAVNHAKQFIAPKEELTAIYSTHFESFL